MYAPSPLAEGEAEPALPRYRVDWGSGIALTVSAFGVLFLGILPNVVLEFARDATQLLAAHL
jgi:NADH:ubiquinone oxidoreductase subunit 2 (subunit N)